MATTNVLTNIENAIKNICKDSSIAAVAGVSASDWSNYHVFVESAGLIGGFNRGRLPAIQILLLNGNYDYQGLSDQSEKGGTVTSNWEIRVSTSRFQRDYTLGLAIIEKLRAWIDTDERFIDSQYTVSPPVNGPFGYDNVLTLTVNNNYGK